MIRVGRHGAHGRHFQKDDKCISSSSHCYYMFDVFYNVKALLRMRLSKTFKSVLDTDMSTRPAPSMLFGSIKLVDQPGQCSRCEREAIYFE